MRRKNEIIKRKLRKEHLKSKRKAIRKYTQEALCSFQKRVDLIRQRLIQSEQSLDFEVEVPGIHNLKIRCNGFDGNLDRDFQFKTITPEEVGKVFSDLYSDLCEFIAPLLEVETTTLNLGAILKARLVENVISVYGFPVKIIELDSNHPSIDKYLLQFGALEMKYSDPFLRDAFFEYARCLSEVYREQSINFQYDGVYSIMAMF